MNLSEIRAKYPQYDSISDDVLVQKLHDKYYPQMDINEFSSRVGYQTQQPRQLSAEELNNIRQKADEANRRAGIDTSAKSVLNAGLDGFNKGVIGGLERLASGATFGATDWMWDKTADITGIDALSPKKRREELEKDSNATKVINAGLDIVGGIPTGGALFKGLSAGAKAIPYAGKALKYLVPTASGAITGGLYSGFENDSLDSAGKGALTGGLVAGALDAGLRGAGKLFSAVEKIKNTPRGFENAVGTKEGARILNRAVRESDDIAERVYGKAPEALDNLNVRAMDKLDDAVKGGVDVKGRMAGAKKAYGDFIDTNKANQVIKGKFTPEEYQANLQKWGKGELVLDKDGKPLVVYHNTPNTFDEFSVDRIGTSGSGAYHGYGINTATSPHSEYGNNELAMYLKAKNPLASNRKTVTKKQLEDLFRQMDVGKQDTLVGDFSGELIPYGSTKYNSKIKSAVDNLWNNAESDLDIYSTFSLQGSNTPKDVIEGFKKLGYDSAKEVFGDDKAIWLAFDPKQLKSVKNSGAFTDTASLSDKGVKATAKVSDLGIKGLTDNQKGWLNQAWSAGKKNTLEKAGSLGHLDEMSKELNKMVQGSRLANPNGVGTIATPETVALQGLKDKVDDVIEKAGLQNIKSQYRQAKALEDSFNQGLNFNPNSVKTRNITFKTPDEQSAFAQGLVEKVKMNPESKNIAGKTRDLRGALRKALGEKADGVFKEMDNINKSYKNVEKVLGNAERKLSVPEPINGKIGLLREFVESPGSVIGGLADFARRWGTAKSAERAAKYLLDPTLKLGSSPYEAIRQYTPTIGGLGIGNLIRKGE